MTDYEKMEDAAARKGYAVYELPLEYTDGVCYGDTIGIREGMTEREKNCVLAEEIAHVELTVGDIIRQSGTAAQKQERLARVAAYNRLIGLSGLASAFDAGCKTVFDSAEFLNVTEEFLLDALNYYRGKYGISTTYGNHIFFFEPHFSIIRYLRGNK